MRSRCDSAGRRASDWPSRFVVELPAAVPLVLTSVSWGGKLAAALAARIRRSEDLACLTGSPCCYPAIFTTIRTEPLAAGRHSIRQCCRSGTTDGGDSISMIPRCSRTTRSGRRFIRDDPQALRHVSLSFLNATLDLTRLATSLPVRNRRRRSLHWLVETTSLNCRRRASGQRDCPQRRLASLSIRRPATHWSSTPAASSLSPTSSTG